ncbi:MAG: YbhN family protein [Candidatus Bathyarchaeia archaeon]
MIKGKLSLKKKSVTVLVAGLLAFVLFLYFFVDMGSVVTTIQQANPVYYSLAFIAAVVNMLFHSLTWWCLLRLLSIRVSFLKVLSFIWIGSFVDILVPAESVSGEITRAYLMSKDSGENMGRIAMSVIGHRILYTTISLVGLIAGSTLFTLRHDVPQLVLSLIVAITVGTAASLVFLLLLCFKRKISQKIVDLLLSFLDFILRGRWRLARLRPKARRTLNAFYEGIKTLGDHPRSLVWLVTFSATAWFFNLLIPFFVFISLGIEPPLSTIVVVFSLTNALQTVPLGIPGEVGLIEITMTSLYTVLGIPSTISSTATILARGVTLWFKLFVGGMMVQGMGIKKLMDGLAKS